MRDAIAMALLIAFSLFAALSAAGMGLFLYQAYKAWRAERRRLKIKRALEIGNAVHAAYRDALTFRRR